jgi:hypothetical protein
MCATTDAMTRNDAVRMWRDCDNSPVENAKYEFSADELCKHGEGSGAIGRGRQCWSRARVMLWWS